MAARHLGPVNGLGDQGAQYLAQVLLKRAKWVWDDICSPEGKCPCSAASVAPFAARSPSSGEAVDGVGGRLTRWVGDSVCVRSAGLSCT